MDRKLKPRDFKTEFQDLYRVAGMSQMELSRQSGVAQPIISRYLSGQVENLNAGVLGRLWPYLEYASEHKGPSDEQVACS